MRRKYSYLSLLALAYLAQPVLAEVTVWNNNVNGWFIGVDGSAGNGCYLHSNFDGGAVLRLGFNVNTNNMYMIIGDDDWKSLEYGKEYPIDVIIGRNTPWYVDASVYTWDDGDNSLIFTISFEDNNADTFVKEFKQALSIKIEYNNDIILDLSLKGSYRAMEETISCQKIMLDVGGSNDDPFKNSSGSSSDPFS